MSIEVVCNISALLVLSDYDGVLLDPSSGRVYCATAVGFDLDTIHSLEIAGYLETEKSHQGLRSWRLSEHGRKRLHSEKRFWLSPEEWAERHFGGSIAKLTLEFEPGGLVTARAEMSMRHDPFPEHQLFGLATLPASSVRVSEDADAGKITVAIAASEVHGRTLA